MKEYKVVSLKEGVFSSKFKPAQLEDMLNEYAADGWILRESIINERNARDQFFFVLERDK